MCRTAQVVNRVIYVMPQKITNVGGRRLYGQETPLDRFNFQWKYSWESLNKF